MGARHFPPLADRLWSKVDMSGGLFECWPWIGMVLDGYGMLKNGAHNDRAHRVAWLVTNGPIPDGLYVLHTCDNRPCCNPAHLFLGTHADNMADMLAKGRQRGSVGSANPEAKLTEAAVADIRRRSAQGATRTSLAREYGVHPSAIYQALLGKTWRHVA